MASERKNASDFAVWVGGQFRAARSYTDQLRTYVDQQLATAATSASAQVASARTDLGTAVTSVRTDMTQLIATTAAATKTEIIGGATAAFDTLGELQAKLAADDSALAGLLDGLAKRVRFDAVQTLTGPEQAQARSNIGAVAVTDLGATEVDYVAVAVAAMNA